MFEKIVLVGSDNQKSYLAISGVLSDFCKVIVGLRMSQTEFNRIQLFVENIKMTRVSIEV